MWKNVLQVFKFQVLKFKVCKKDFFKMSEDFNVCGKEFFKLLRVSTLKFEKVCVEESSSSC